MVGPPTYPAPIQHTTRAQSHESFKRIVSHHVSPLTPRTEREHPRTAHDLDRRAIVRKNFRETAPRLIAPLSSTPPRPRRARALDVDRDRAITHSS